MDSVENKANYAKAKELATSLLSKVLLKEPPVIAQELAEFCGLRVIYLNFATIKPEYAGISGFINPNTNTLYINSVESSVRKNFTIAHELGHYLLGHTTSPEYGNLLYRRPLEEQDDPIIEQEANCFAANLLVPETFLKNILKKYPFATNRELSDIFGVSETMIRFRRNFLGV